MTQILEGTDILYIHMKVAFVDHCKSLGNSATGNSDQGEAWGGPQSCCASHVVPQCAVIQVYISVPLHYSLYSGKY